MYNFFLTIILIAGAVISVLIYYAIRSSILKKRRDRMALQSWRKLYSDEENYIRSRIRALLVELTNGKIQWIILQSAFQPSARFEITFSTLRKLITVIFLGRELSNSEEKLLVTMGVDSYEKNEENNIIYCGSNSKIICDVIFYLMDKIFGVKYVKKIYVKVSGGF